MIVTVTLNACVHRYLVFRDDDPTSTVVRPVRTTAGSGGKGFNVARVLTQLGEECRALGFAGGALGQVLADCLRSEGVEAELVPTASETRSSYGLFDEASGRFREFLEEGSDAELAEAAELLLRVERLLAGARAVALSGSSPGPVCDPVFAQCVERARVRGSLVVLDSYGETARLALEAGPSWLRCNREELESTFGLRLDDLPNWVRQRKHRGLQGAVISDGPGRIDCVTADGRWWIEPPSVVERNAVGSGDALTAGFLLGLLRGEEPAVAVCSGAAAGAANAESVRVCEITPARHQELLRSVRMHAVQAV